MIDIDITMLIQIVNILFLIVILNAVLYKPVLGILAKRKKKLSELETDAANYRKNAKLRGEEFDKKLLDVGQQAKAKLDEARSEAQAAGNETLAKIRNESDSAKTSQLSQVKSDFATAQKELSGQLDSFANEMASKVLGRAV